MNDEYADLNARAESDRLWGEEQSQRALRGEEILRWVLDKINSRDYDALQANREMIRNYLEDTDDEADRYLGGRYPRTD